MILEEIPACLLARRSKNHWSDPYGYEERKDGKDGDHGCY